MCRVAQVQAPMGGKGPSKVAHGEARNRATQQKLLTPQSVYSVRLLRLIQRPKHGHARGVILLQCVGVVAVGCVFEARRPWLRISSALHWSLAFDVPIDETNVLSWAHAP